MNLPSGIFDEHLLAGVLAASPDCVNALAADGTVLFINARGVALMEYASEDMIRGKNFADGWPENERAKVVAAIEGAATGRLTQFEGYCPTALGKPRWWEVRFAPIEAKDGQPARIAGISRDISDRRLAELAARSNEGKFSLLLESSGDGIYGMALDGNCIFINRTGAHMLGYEPGFLVGKLLHDIIHHHRPDGSIYPLQTCEIFKAARSGTSRRVDDEVFWHQDGHAVPVTYSVFPMLVDGAQTGTVITYSDTTERRRVEHDLRRFAAELSEADRRKTEFLATLAHELRNPLAPLRNGLELLSKAGDNPEAVAKVRDMMQRQLAQLVHLINDLLDLARISSGKMELRREIVELKRVVAIAIEASTPAINDGGHRMLVDIPTMPLVLNVDVTRMTQVLSNILNNAAKYTPPGGRIALSARMLDEAVEIRVIDNGVGIAAESLDAVFEMFTQVGREVSAVPGGLGIGLNLVRRLVELHGGTVSASSAGRGLGSMFTVILPVAAVVQSKSTSKAKSSAAPSGVRVLIVDDNVDAADSMAMLLSLGDHHTETAHSAQDALEALAYFRPDVIFLDIGMPVMNGYELARAIRLKQGSRPIKLVALTGWGGVEDRKRSQEAGFDDHLTKPAEFEDVERMLNQLKTH